MAALRERFHAAHERLYGYALAERAGRAGEPARHGDGAAAEGPSRREIPPQAGSIDAARVGERRVYFGRA